MGLDWRRFIVAVDGRGLVIGCGQIKEHQGGVRELASLVVSPEWRGQAIGRAIVRRLMAETVPPVWLMCRSGLVPYYLTFGFSEVGAAAPQPRYFRRIRTLAKAMMFSGRRDYLAVMCWDGQGSDGRAASPDDKPKSD